jgi:hypothetical protein
MSDSFPWFLSGTYYEVCNCEAICPCRANRDVRRSTYEQCDFALSWHITDGHTDLLDLSGFSVVLAGAYHREEPAKPPSHWPPWRVVLYLDENVNSKQQSALTDIFLGRAGGDTVRNFAHAIDDVYAIRLARIDLNHASNHEQMKVGEFVTARTREPVVTDELVFCGVPGAEQPGQEIVAGRFRVDDAPLRWEISGRCGFAKEFTYSSED